MNNDVKNETGLDMENERSIDLRELLSVLVSKAIWIVLCVAICMVGALVYTKAFTKPQYSAKAVIYVNDGNMSSTGNVAIATYLAEDYAKTVKLRTVLETAIDNLALNMSYGELASKINVSLEEQSRIVEITLTDTSPARAQALCNEICYVSKARFEQMTNVERVSVYEEASLPTGSSGPGLTSNMIVGAMIGLVVPCAVILFIYMIDDRVKSPEDVQRALKLSTLGSIPYHKEKE